jgi:hypothetical protein
MMLRNDPLSLPVRPEDEAVLEAGRAAARQGLSPDEVAACVFRAIQDEQLYIFTHPETKAWVRTFVEHMLAGHPLPVAPL